MDQLIGFEEEVECTETRRVRCTRRVIDLLMEDVKEIRQWGRNEFDFYRQSDEHNDGVLERFYMMCGQIDERDLEMYSRNSRDFWYANAHLVTREFIEHLKR